jgi:hypothetical protein
MQNSALRAPPQFVETDMMSVPGIEPGFNYVIVIQLFIEQYVKNEEK